MVRWTRLAWDALLLLKHSNTNRQINNINTAPVILLVILLWAADIACGLYFLLTNFQSEHSDGMSTGGVIKMTSLCPNPTNAVGGSLRLNLQTNAAGSHFEFHAL